jgi:hypothetical protein
MQYCNFDDVLNDTEWNKIKIKKTDLVRIFTNNRIVQKQLIAN